MCTIDIGIRHDNDFIISELADIKIFVNSCSESRNHRFDFRICINSVQTRFLYIQNFTSKWKNRLSRTASCSLCRTTGRITLYDVNFAFRRVFIHTVCQLSRKRHSLKRSFSSG